ncbi:MAG: hypothetical protein KAS32_15320, partial [Candidatus Peribacteraceae bacterium]|nr:hypothetical protein [Candidatus Peribacteraceae bacterium]
MSSFHQMYPKIENIFPGTTSDFQTFISLLNSLSLTDSLMFCMRVNHILLDWNKTHEDKQRNIAQLFFSEEEIGKMFTGSPRISSFSELLIVSKGSITHLARWIVMYCQDQEGDGTTFKDPKIRQIFAKALLIINDVWSQDIQMEHMLDDVPIEETRYNLLSTFRQNSAGSHIPT